MNETPKKSWFLRQLSLDSIVQSAALLITGIVWGTKVEARLAALEMVKNEAKITMEANYKELRDAQTKLTEQVTRLVVMEEVRQRQASK